LSFKLIIYKELISGAKLKTRLPASQIRAEWYIRRTVGRSRLLRPGCTELNFLYPLRCLKCPINNIMQLFPWKSPRVMYYK